MSRSGERQSSRGPEGSAGGARNAFHAEVRRRRCALGLSRDELARLTGYSRQYVCQLEQPSRGVPARPVVIAVDAALGAGGELTALRDLAASARPAPLPPGRDPERASRRRVRELLHHRRCDTDLDCLDQLAGELIELADELSPQDIRTRVQDQQEFVDLLLRTPMLPHQQFRLFMIAGHLAGLLALALLDLDDLPGANACRVEATVFTELTGHEGLRAWTAAVGRLVDDASRRAGTTALSRAEAFQPDFAQRVEPGRHTGYPDETDRQETAPPKYESPEAEAQEFETQEFAVVGGTPETSDDPRALRMDEFAGSRPAGGEQPALDTDTLSSPWRGLADLMPAPGGRASTPRLVAMVKGRNARSATTRRGQPPSGISRAFHPPV